MSRLLGDRETGGRVLSAARDLKVLQEEESKCRVFILWLCLIFPTMSFEPPSPLIRAAAIFPTASLAIRMHARPISRVS